MRCRTFARRAFCCLGIGYIGHDSSWNSSTHDWTRQPNLPYPPHIVNTNHHCYNPHHRDIAQLVECTHGVREVVSSSLTIPTRNKLACPAVNDSERCGVQVQSARQSSACPVANDSELYGVQVWLSRQNHLNLDFFKPLCYPMDQHMHP